MLKAYWSFLARLFIIGPKGIWIIFSNSPSPFYWMVYKTLDGLENKFWSKLPCFWCRDRENPSGSEIVHSYGKNPPPESVSSSQDVATCVREALCLEACAHMIVLLYAFAQHLACAQFALLCISVGNLVGMGVLLSDILLVDTLVHIIPPFFEMIHSWTFTYIKRKKKLETLKVVDNPYLPKRSIL